MNVMPKGRDRWSLAILAVLLSTVVAMPALAQTPFGSIDGTVRDETGSVLPGTTVEATSPALIEGTRTTVTDATGSYQFLRLPVGEYALKFSLAGFANVQRSNVAINASFTATINAALKIGGLEETLTVTGGAPLVDVRTTTSQLVVTAEVVNTIPSSRHIFDMSKFVLGSSTSTPDVGGSTGFQFIATKIHGSRPSDRLFYIDGVSATGYAGDGSQPFSYGNTGAQQELDYQTTAIPAWYPIGGVTINTVTKSGGNRMSGDLFVNSQAYQSANLDDHLRSLGVRATSGSKGSFDLDGALGGPLVKDRAWFFVDSRTFALDVLPANNFNPDGVTQADDFTWRPELFYKVSTQINQNNKLSISNTTTFYDRPARRAGASFIAPEATYYDGRNHENFFETAIWTGTHGTSWIYEIQQNNFHRLVWNSYNSRVGPNDVARLDITKDLLYGAPTSITHAPQDGHIINGSVTRIGNWYGSHQVRTGAQLNWGHYENDYNYHGDIILRFRNGVPDSVDLLNTPIVNDNNLRNLGLYFQDSWRINRLTVDAGVRYDDFHSSIPAQSSPAGTWVPARQYAGIDVMTWRNVKPRLGLVLDLTGDARTVVKGSFSEYVGNEATSLDTAVNPLAKSSNRCAWTDTNKDLYAQADEISRCAGFPEVNTVIDPNLKRPSNREYNVGIQRQLGANWAASAMFFRRENTSLRATQNLAVPFDSYIPVVITNPLTNQPLTIYNQSAATTGLQTNILTNSSKLDDTFNGVEVGIKRRFSSDAYMEGGYAYGRDTGRISAGELNDPNFDIYGNGAVGPDEPHQLKLSAAFRLPGSISVGAFFQAYSGLPRQTTLSVSRTLVPTLTRASQTVNLEANDANRYDPIKMLDLRLGRPFKVNSWRFEVFADAYNLLNSNTVISQVTTFGTSLGQVSDTLGPRLVKVGGKFSF